MPTRNPNDKVITNPIERPGVRNEVVRSARDEGELPVGAYLTDRQTCTPESLAGERREHLVPANSDLANKVRKGKLAGPSERKFDRKLWLELLDRTADASDRSFLEAGLIFDDIFTTLRGASRASDLGMNPDFAIKASIAITNMGYLTSFALESTAPPDGILTDGIFLPEALQRKSLLPSGEAFTPDELITSAGDGLRHLIGTLVRQVNAKPPPSSGSENKKLSEAQFESLMAEINVAVTYRTAETLWQDCYGNGFRFKQEQPGLLVLAANDQQLTKIRVASSFRRYNSIAQDILASAIEWRRRLNESQQRTIDSLPAVIRISGYSSIEHIEIGFRRQERNQALLGLMNEFEVETGPMGIFLDEPLPNFGDTTLRQVIHGWRMTKSLCEALLARIKFAPSAPNIDVNISAPAIPARIFQAMIAKALRVSNKQATHICNALTFRGSKDCDLWAQPLIKLDDAYHVVITCAHSARLTPLVDAWLLRGGFKLSEKGPAFEDYCRTQIDQAVRRSNISRNCYVQMCALSFAPKANASEEIDILLIVGNTVVVFEAKCLFWPSDPIQFANYTETMTSAAAQASRKRDFLVEHKELFVAHMARNGHKCADSLNVVGAILLSNEACSGYSIDGIPIVDLSIVEHFFANEVVHLQFTNEGKETHRFAERIYESGQDAPSKLPGYLLDPPEVRAFVKKLCPRVTRFPLLAESGKQICYESFEVKFTLAETLARFTT